LVDRLEAMGGVKYLYLTHRDDIADHQKFHDRFKCDRILHQDEIAAETQSVERKLQGLDAIALTDQMQQCIRWMASV
jgi:hypothetical protein